MSKKQRHKHNKQFHKWITLPFSGVMPIMACAGCKTFFLEDIEAPDFLLVGGKTKGKTCPNPETNECWNYKVSINNES